MVALLKSPQFNANQKGTPEGGEGADYRVKLTAKETNSHLRFASRFSGGCGCTWNLPGPPSKAISLPPHETIFKGKRRGALRTSGALYVLDLAVVTRLVLCYLGKGPSKAIASAGGIDVHVADSDGHTSLF